MLWVWPLPGEGDVSVLLEWTAAGIALRTYRLDGQTLRTAAAGAEPFWAG